ncbi:MAG TPA: hypothetical protein VHO67_12360 [Polyangia bacterium]|nr:hypothetical protein [Polyangia bacterium]
MRHVGRAWLVGAAAVALAAGCEQTLHLYQAVPDAGSRGGGAGSVAAAGGTTGGAGAGGGRSGTGGMTDGGPPDGRCAGPATPVAFTADPPQMLIALDRSTNMNQPFDNSSTNDNNTQFQAAAQTLSQAVGMYSAPAGGTKATRPTVNFSFLNFPETSSGCTAQTGCCTTDVSRIYGFQDFATDAFMCSQPTAACVSSDHRPMAAALTKADQWAAGLTGTGGRYVVLVTDGPPSGNCVKMYDDCTNAEQQAMTLAKDTSHQPVVLRIGGSTGGDCLFYIAGGPNSPAYYQAPDYTSLSKAVTDIMTYAICEVTLTGPVPGSLQVTVGGKSYSYDASAGWTLSSSGGRLRLHGAACDAYADGGKLQVQSGCEPGRGGSGFPP